MDEELPDTFEVHIRVSEREVLNETITRNEIKDITIGEWKQILCTKYPRIQPPENTYLRFIFRGAFMEDHRLVSVYRLCEGSTIHASFGSRPPSQQNPSNSFQSKFLRSRTHQNAANQNTPDIVMGTKPLNFLCGIFLGFLWMLFVTRGEELFDVISTFMLLALTFAFISWVHQGWYPQQPSNNPLQHPHQY